MVDFASPKEYHEHVCREEAAMDRLPKELREAIANANDPRSAVDVLTIYESTEGSVHACLRYIKTGKFTIDDLFASI